MTSSTSESADVDFWAKDLEPNDHIYQFQLLSGIVANTSGQKRTVTTDSHVYPTVDSGVVVHIDGIAYTIGDKPVESPKIMIDGVEVSAVDVWQVRLKANTRLKHLNGATQFLLPDSTVATIRPACTTTEQFVFAHNRNTLFLCSANTMEVIKEIQFNRGIVAVVLSPNQKLIAVVTGGAFLEVFETTNFQPVEWKDWTA